MKIKYNIFSCENEINIYNSDICHWIVLKGSGRIITGKKDTYSLKTQDYVRFVPNDNYTFIPDESVIIGTIVIFDFSPTISAFQCLKGHETELLRKTFLYCIELQSYDIPNKRSLMSAADTLIWNVLVSMGISSDEINPFVLKVLEDMDTHLTEPDYNCFKEVEQTGYSLSHFRKLFRDATGLPPVEFLIRQRIDRAKILLQQSDSTVSLRQIAEQCGFSDPYYFSRQFKKLEHMSPTEYIARHRK